MYNSEITAYALIHLITPTTMLTKQVQYIKCI